MMSADDTMLESLLENTDAQIAWTQPAAATTSLFTVDTIFCCASQTNDDVTDAGVSADIESDVKVNALGVITKSIVFTAG